MDNLDDSENNAKISDSAYSNSCSNSQSRRSRSSKSTHSGSNSSGSSGYGGQPSTSSYSNNTSSQLPEKRNKEKEAKKKKPLQIDFEAPTVAECRAPVQEPIAEDAEEECHVAPPMLPPTQTLIEKTPEDMEISTPDRCSSKEDDRSCNTPLLASVSYVASRPVSSYCDGFSCVISMHDGVVMYTTSSLTTNLGFPKDMWIGRSFIDFVHPRDRNTFASQITSGLAVPKNVNGTIEKAASPSDSMSTMVCRIRRHRGLNTGFGVKERVVTFMPFLLKLSFKNVIDEEGKAVYLVIQASPFFSAFKTPNEMVVKAIPFVIRHAANGNLQYIDPESVPYLGYLPQDLMDKDALQLYHPEDLVYLRQLYETIVKEGGVPLSKPFRLIAQNGDYIKVETEWSSFINPWSRKLEFVIAKHHILEGPLNPDVFQLPDPDKALKLTDEERARVQALKESIIRIINEVLTKPAEVAKQQMSKRCQDLASFMESLMEDQPKIEDELRLEIQDPENSYYERDSVMLGGISPHHDYNDSKSSTETPLSYNQLNYNENLQRYFDSHQPFSHEDYQTVTSENAIGTKEKFQRGGCLSPVAQHSGDSNEMSSCGSCLIRDSSPEVSKGDYMCVRLTESLLMRHNNEMEKELMKVHREIRSSSKGEREKTANETRMKKKEHLARCNAAFQPTSAGTTETVQAKPHGVKRSSKQMDSDTLAHKHHCSSQRLSRRWHSGSTPPVQHSSTITTTVAAHWPTTPVNNMNAFIMGVGIPQQMSILGPMTAMPGMFPMYYTPAAPALPPGAELSQDAGNNSGQYATPVMMYGSPFMYSPVNPAQVPYPLQQNVVAQTMQYSHSSNTLGLARSNYEEACKQSVLHTTKSHSGAAWREKMRADSQQPSKIVQGSAESSNCSAIALNRSTDAIPESTPSRESKRKFRLGNGEEMVDRTDGESSYSSFYSSFFKTESGSAEDSGDGKKQNTKDMGDYYGVQASKKVARRKMEPPWMEQVCVSSELIYKYQILTKGVEEVLKADKLKMERLEQHLGNNSGLAQGTAKTFLTTPLNCTTDGVRKKDKPSLVNEQLGQLYLDLQLEGVAARLTLEEGVSSSSSSGEECSSRVEDAKMAKTRRKRKYSKLVMIYEEDAPLPPPEAEPSTSDV